MKANPSWIIIVDIFWKGHVPQYHKFFIENILGRNFHVLSISDGLAEIKHWSKSLDKKDRKRFHAIQFDSTHATGYFVWLCSQIFSFFSILENLGVPKSGFFKKFFSVVYNWRNLNSIINKFSIQHEIKPILVFIGYLDSSFLFTGITSKIVDAIFKHPWSGVYLGPTEFRATVLKRGKSIVERLFPAHKIFLSKNLRAVFVSDEAVIKPMSAYANSPVLFLPELMKQTLPQSESELTRKIKKKAGQRKVVSLLGVIAKRKGVELFVKTANSLLSENMFFLVAGKINQDKDTDFVIEKLSELQANSYTYLQTIEEDKYFNELIQLSDIVFLGYRAFYHGSGILTKAAYFNRPVIATKGHCIGERVEKYNLGITIEEDNHNQYIAALKLLTYNPELQMSSACKEYLNIHSISNFNKSLNKLVKIIGKG